MRACVTLVEAHGQDGKLVLAASGWLTWACGPVLRGLHITRCQEGASKSQEGEVASSLRLGPGHYPQYPKFLAE